MSGTSDVAFPWPRKMFSKRLWQTLPARRWLSSQETALHEIYDIVVVGGGIAGTALVCALAQNEGTKNAKVLLIEAGKAPNRAVLEGHFDNRVSSFTPRSMHFISSAAGSNIFADSRVKPFRRMEVWDALSSGHINFDAKEIGEDVLGCFAENSLIHQVLYSVASTQSNITVVTQETLERISQDGNPPPHFRTEPLMRLRLKSGKQTLARLVVGADGAQSVVREQSELDSIGWDYQHHGVVATLGIRSPANELNDTAWQRFLPTGPIALLPIAETHSSLVWSTSPSNARLLQQMQPNQFVEAVNAALQGSMADLDHLLSLAAADGPFKPSLGWASLDRWRQTDNTPNAVKERLPFVEFVQENSRAAFPLRLRHSPQYTRPRVALIGDAAHVVHPLAGQGLNLGLADAETLVALLAKARSAGQDVGDPLVLEEYARNRIQSNIPIMTAIDGLYRLFGAQSEPIVGLRSFGLKALSTLSPLKNTIMAYAMGIRTQ